MSTPPSGPRRAPGILFDDGSNTCAIDGPLFVQVRRGRLSFDGVDRLVSAARTFLGQRKTGNVGAVAILERTADVPSEEVRAHQRERMGSLMDDPRVFMAAVVLGDDTGAMLRRAVARGVAHRNKRTFTGIDEAVEWMAEQLGVGVPAVRTLVDRARKP